MMKYYQSAIIKGLSLAYINNGFFYGHQFMITSGIDSLHAIPSSRVVGLDEEIKVPTQYQFSDLQKSESLDDKSSFSDDDEEPANSPLSFRGELARLATILTDDAEHKEPSETYCLPATPAKEIFKESLLNGLALCGINSAVNVNIFVSGTILKAVSESTLAAYSLVYSETAALVLLFIAPLNSINVIVSHNQKKGASADEIAKTIQAGWIFAGILTIPSLVISSINKPMLSLFQQKDDVVDIVQGYFYISMVGWLPLYLQFASGQFLSGLKKRFVPLILDMFVLGLSIFLTETLALGKFGAKRLDIQGYAWSFSISNWVNLAGYQAILLFHKDFRQFELYKKRPDLSKELYKLFKMGMPIMVAYMGEAGIILSSSLMAGKLGQEQLTAQSIFGLYLVLLTVPSLSLFESTSVLVSGALGAKRLKDIRPYILANLSLSIVSPVIALILTLSISKKMMQPFIDPDNIYNKNIVDDLYISLPLLAAGNIFDSARMVLSGALLGMQDVEVSSIVNAVIQLFVIIPLMYALSFHTPLDVNGIMTAYLLGSFILTVYTSVRSYDVSKKLLASSSEDIASDEMITSFGNSYGALLTNDETNIFSQARTSKAKITLFKPISDKHKNNYILLQNDSISSTDDHKFAARAPIISDSFEEPLLPSDNVSSTDDEYIVTGRGLR
jgi:MATE family multidrug resistance protein